MSRFSFALIACAVAACSGFSLPQAPMRSVSVAATSPAATVAVARADLSMMAARKPVKKIAKKKPVKKVAKKVVKKAAPKKVVRKATPKKAATLSYAQRQKATLAASGKTTAMGLVDSVTDVPFLAPVLQNAPLIAVWGLILLKFVFFYDVAD